MRADHNSTFYSTKLAASSDITAYIKQASWSRDCTDSIVHLQPSDILIAATDGLFDALHIFSPPGLESRRFIRKQYFEQQCDPGHLAEQLLVRARTAVYACKRLRMEDMNTPFAREAVRNDLTAKFNNQMPEDDIAVVVSYALQC